MLQHLVLHATGSRIRSGRCRPGALAQTLKPLCQLLKSPEAQ